jgi:hypothetical protein
MAIQHDAPLGYVAVYTGGKWVPVKTTGTSQRIKQGCYVHDPQRCLLCQISKSRKAS